LIGRAHYYTRDLLADHRSGFGVYNVLAEPVRETFYSRIDLPILQRILLFLEESTSRKMPVAIHFCEHGWGTREKQILTAWLAHQHGLAPKEALQAVGGGWGLSRGHQADILERLRLLRSWRAPIHSLVRRRLRQHILAKYGSLKRFYLETNFWKDHLSQILRGQRNPSFATMEKFAKLVDVEVGHLFRPERPPPPRPPRG